MWSSWTAVRNRIQSVDFFEGCCREQDFCSFNDLLVGVELRVGKILLIHEKTIHTFRALHNSLHLHGAGEVKLPLQYIDALWNARYKNQNNLD